MDGDGDCYEAAASFLVLPAHMRHPFGTECPEGAYLVHGRPTLTRPPFKPYGHAWVETRETVEVVLPTGERYEHEVVTVYDVANRKTILGMPGALYYAVGKIDPAECYRYDLADARAMLLAFGHYGPWEGPEGCGPVEGGTAYDGDGNDEP